MHNIKTQIAFRSPITLVLAVSAFFLVLHNFRFWTETVNELWQGTVDDTLFIGSLFLFLLFVHASFLLLIPGRRLFQAVVATLFIIAAAASYSTDTYGVFIDKDMVRNLFETDRREAAALFNPGFFLYISVLGILPAILVWRTDLQRIGIKQHLLQRLIFFIAGTALSTAMLLALFTEYSSFIHDHKNLRRLLSPGAAIEGTLRYARENMLDKDKDANRLVDEDGVNKKLPRQADARPLLMFMVVGETARARNFQLGGYDRSTNPELTKTDNLYYFRHMNSCGTSTAISLPCMFSHLSREKFSVSRANHTTNLLDALAKAGVGVEWRENNSGSKGVSARVPTISYIEHPDPALCNGESCYDEIMFKDVDKSVNAAKNDTVIVFHQMGSHGPAYSKRFPPAFERFAPMCDTNELKRCTDEQVRNTYDNTIVYTDHNLARQIKILKSLSDRFDTMLIYVSDHGESLGENGLYLHGAPYAFAPEEQTNVPLIFWMSDGYRKRFSINAACISAQLNKQFSHDNLYHTVLGAMGVTNAVYRRAMDMLDSCKENSLIVNAANAANSAVAANAADVQ